VRCLVANVSGPAPNRAEGVAEALENTAQALDSSVETQHAINQVLTSFSRGVLFAAECGYMRTVEVLLGAGVDSETTDPSGKTALDFTLILERPDDNVCGNRVRGFPVSDGAEEEEEINQNLVEVEGWDRDAGHATRARRLRARRCRHRARRRPLTLQQLAGLDAADSGVAAGGDEVPPCHWCEGWLQLSARSPRRSRHT